MTDFQYVAVFNLNRDVTPSALGNALQSALHEMGADDGLYTHFEEYWGDHSEVTLPLVINDGTMIALPIGTVTLLPATTEAEAQHVMSRLEDMAEESEA
jgi:hypothetical protein